MKSLPQGFHALVLGAGGALGGAFVERLQADHATLQSKVVALDESKVSAKVLTERLVGQKRDILQKVEISRLSGKPLLDDGDA